MKAKVKIALPGYTGSMGDMVIYYNSTLNCLIARRKAEPKQVPSNADFIAIGRLAKTLNLAQGFIDDCRRYARLYNQKNRRRNRVLPAWNNVFYRMMMLLKKQNPGLNLVTLTKAEIISNVYPCLSIQRAVDGELLERVTGYQELNLTM